MSGAAPYRLHHSLAYQLSIVTRLQERRLDEGLKQLGLTRTTWCILLAVENEALSHPSDIAAFIGIDRTAISRALKQMEKVGLVDRRRGDKDKRTTMVVVTQKGQGLLAPGTAMARANNYWLAGKLGLQESAELFALLVKLREGEDVPLAAL